MVPFDLLLLQDVFAGRRGFPGPWFWDETLFRAETEVLLQRNWAALGYADDVPGAGDVQPIQFAGLPLILLRDRLGMVRVFHNVCSHRGAILVHQPAQDQGRLVCNYHCWSYLLDGRLETTPHAGGYRLHVTPEAPREALGLREVRSVLWNGIVFIDLSGQAESFSSYIAPTEARLSVLDFGVLRPAPEYRQAFDLRANWKSVIENYVESYHVPMVHPRLERHNPMSAHYQILGGRAYAGQGGKAYGAATNPEAPPAQILPPMPGLKAAPFDYEGLHVSPNLILTPLDTYLTAIILYPQAPDHTHEEMRFWFYGDAAMTPEMKPGRDEAVWSMIGVNSEDIAIVESCQRGRRSPAFTGGVFVRNQEATSLLIQRQMAGRLLEGCGVPVDWASLPVEDIHHPVTA